jgi:hypothetical protein
MDMLPGYWGDLLQKQDRLLIAAGKPPNNGHLRMTVMITHPPTLASDNTRAASIGSFAGNSTVALTVCTGPPLAPVSATSVLSP